MMSVTKYVSRRVFDGTRPLSAIEVAKLRAAYWRMRPEAKRALRVRCPLCKAPPWHGCRALNYNGSWSGTRPHKERLDKANNDKEPH